METMRDMRADILVYIRSWRVPQHLQLCIVLRYPPALMTNWMQRSASRPQIDPDRSVSTVAVYKSAQAGQLVGLHVSPRAREGCGSLNSSVRITCREDAKKSTCMQYS